MIIIVTVVMKTPNGYFGFHGDDDLPTKTVLVRVSQLKHGAHSCGFCHC